MVLGIKDAVNQLSPAMQKDYRDDLSTPSAPSFLPSEPFLPVKAVGAGIARANAKQIVKTLHISKAAAATTYTQVATVSATTRVFYLGVMAIDGQFGVAESVFIEDASSGNIAPSDASTSALDYWDNNIATDNRFLGVPRECTQGIRVRMVVNGATDHNITVYYLEEQVNA